MPSLRNFERVTLKTHATVPRPTRACMHAPIQTYTRVHSRTRTRINFHRHTHTRARGHTHIHTHMQERSLLNVPTLYVRFTTLCVTCGHRQWRYMIYQTRISYIRTDARRGVQTRCPASMLFPLCPCRLNSLHGWASYSKFHFPRWDYSICDILLLFLIYIDMSKNSIVFLSIPNPFYSLSFLSSSSSSVDFFSLYVLFRNTWNHWYWRINRASCLLTSELRNYFVILIVTFNKSNNICRRAVIIKV